MAQIKIYALRSTLDQQREALSAAIHTALVAALGLPADKRFQRFIALDAADFLYPADRSVQYVIIEISMFAGRSLETKKQLIRQLYAGIAEHCGIDAQDVEITLFETPRENWGIRGVPADELQLNYQVQV